MKAINVRRPAWKQVLNQDAPLVLPAAHDALSARIIERGGFKAFQVGGFALAASMHAVPDLDLEHFGEKSSVVGKILNASPLPALVDADDGYGDVKNVTRTVHEYEAMGAAAIFLEDQTSPKRCGHMSGKTVVPAKQMVEKIRAAVGARINPDFFILARTDAIQPEGLKNALGRAEKYLKAGADGVYLEGAETLKELKQIGSSFKGIPLAISILEGGGKTPWLPPMKYFELGFTMLLYPTSLLFRTTRAMELAVADLHEGKPLNAKEAVSFEQFEKIVEMEYWANLETRYTQP